jgi:hypothetical protein
MNTGLAVMVAAVVVAAGIGPFIAVKRGGDAYDFYDDDADEPAPHDDDDDTTQIPRVTDQADRYMY